MTLSSRDLKRTAHEKLHNAKNQREIILLYAAITLGLGLVILLLQLTLNQKISHTGGLSGMNRPVELSAPCLLYCDHVSGFWLYGRHAAGQPGTVCLPQCPENRL